MNPEIKAKWVAALRSGEYKQGTKRLRNGDKFCCLGVLCDVVDPAKWIPSSDINSLTYMYADDESSTEAPVSRSAQILSKQSEPPDELLESINASNLLEIIFQVKDSSGSLVHLNDDLLYTFEQIADLIEKEKLI